MPDVNQVFVSLFIILFPYFNFNGSLVLLFESSIFVDGKEKRMETLSMDVSDSGQFLFFPATCLFD